MTSLCGSIRAGIMTFDFTSTGGIKEAEIVLNLPAASLSDIKSFAILPSNDMGLPAGPVIIPPTPGIFAGPLDLDAAGTGLTSTAQMPPASLDLNPIFIGLFNEDMPEPDTIILAGFGAITGDWELASVPEPSSLILWGTGTAAVMGWGFRRRLKNLPKAPASSVHV
jgi:hypothetical protein